VNPPDDHSDGGCSGGEVFALRVIGHSMAPEFAEGEIIIIEPDGALRDGRYVLARHADEFIFRQLRATPEGGWQLHALNPAWPDLPLPGLDAVHGVIIQKAVPGRRRLSKSYL
jgi:SOS-response transcriptional repressor LexA